MRYETYSFLYPPRPDQIISPLNFPFYERRGWACQTKKNGSSNVVAISPSAELVWKTRHNTDHKLWTPTVRSEAAFKRVAGSGWHVIVSELLHSKVKKEAGGIKDSHYIHDILVWNGLSLVGTTYRERHDLLREMFLVGGEAEGIDAYQIDANTSLAKIHEGSFAAFIAQLDKPEDEGAVFKDPDATLEFCTRENSNSAWQRKFRHPTRTNHG